MVATLQSPIVRIQRANPGGSQTEQRAPDWRRFTAPARPSSYRGDGLTASERPPYEGGTSDRTAAAYLPPRRFEELENAIGGDGGPVRTIAELVPQLVASLLELEDSANFRQLFGRDGYEPHGAVFHCRLIALEEGMARQSPPGAEASRRVSPVDVGPPRCAPHNLESAASQRHRARVDTCRCAPRGRAPA